MSSCADATPRNRMDQTRRNGRAVQYWYRSEVRPFMGGGLTEGVYVHITVYIYPYSLQQDALLCPRRFDRPKDHRQTLDVVVALAHWRRTRLEGIDEITQ
jgi:hypothetical protein